MRGLAMTSSQRRIVSRLYTVRIKKLLVLGLMGKFSSHDSVVTHCSYSSTPAYCILSGSLSLAGADAIHLHHPWRCIGFSDLSSTWFGFRSNVLSANMVQHALVYLIKVEMVLFGFSYRSY